MKKVMLSLVLLLMTASVFAQNQDDPNSPKVRVPSGYQGFLEQGNTWHFDKNMPNCISLSTTHGFYFNGHIFVGVGLGFDFNKKRTLVPFYTNLRYQFNNTRVVSPVVSLRLGSFIGDDMGAYGDLGFGVRFASKRDFAVSMLVTGTYYDKINMTVNESNLGYGHEVSTKKDVSPAGISLRIGIEW